jgi:predicted nucleotidyltransferase
MFGSLQTIDSVVYFKALKCRLKIENPMDIQKEIENISSQIIAKYKPEKVILFGSAARGEAGPDSDLDFLIIKKDPPHFGEDRIRELSRLIERKVPVDFVVYRPDEFEQRLRMGDPFLKSILKEGKVLHG